MEITGNTTQITDFSTSLLQILRKRSIQVDDELLIYHFVKIKKTVIKEFTLISDASAGLPVNICATVVRADSAEAPEPIPQKSDWYKKQLGKKYSETE